MEAISQNIAQTYWVVSSCQQFIAFECQYFSFAPYVKTQVKQPKEKEMRNKCHKLIILTSVHPPRYAQPNLLQPLEKV